MIFELAQLKKKKKKLLKKNKKLAKHIAILVIPCNKLIGTSELHTENKRKLIYVNTYTLKWRASY